LVECYAGQSALAAHRETEHYKTYRKLIEALLEKPITVTVMEEIDVKR
jgi:quinol monooxygenase YgiN